MEVSYILEEFNNTQNISVSTINFISNDNKGIRMELVSHFRQNKNRQFALALLDKCIEMRKSEVGLPGNDLMLASYILGLHNTIEDCLKIWDAKTTDFDTYCYVDIHLTVFAGVDETIAFLKDSNHEDSDNALTYISECRECGDFDSIDNYFAEENPWFA